MKQNPKKYQRCKKVLEEIKKGTYKREEHDDEEERLVEIREEILSL